jgi:NTE family protein
MELAMSTKTILILQGGGALGAYECGVYQALVPYMKEHNQILTVVAGTSMGAINASLIAKNYGKDDGRGAPDLKLFWTDVLANPSFPGPSVWQRWRAVWTSLLRGHPHPFTPILSLSWVLRAPVTWGPQTYFYETQVMEQTLAQYFESYPCGKDDPRLIVTAVDVKTGKSKAFDSKCQCIMPEHVVASGSLPPMFAAKEIKRKKEIEGKEIEEKSYYWDGGLWSNTPLREVLNALQQDCQEDQQPLTAVQQVEPVDEAYQVYIVDVFPQQGRVPQDNWEVGQRINEITYADKTEYELKACEWVNWCIELAKLVQTLQKYVPPQDKQIAEEIDQQYQKYKKIYQETKLNKRILLQIMRIQRSGSNLQDNVSRELDFSPKRIEELVCQ